MAREKDIEYHLMVRHGAGNRASVFSPDQMNTAGDTLNRCASRLACALLMLRRPDRTSETLPRPPKIGASSAGFRPFASIKYCRAPSGVPSGRSYAVFLFCFFCLCCCFCCVFSLWLC